MDINYIIIQAGGKGSRLKHMTRNKPKAIVPVNNRPLIFHLFERYTDAHFVIIGDYKYSILENYLNTFAQVKFTLVRTSGKGNGSGIRSALKYIQNDQPFLLLWSDIILSDKLQFDSLPSGNYIGLTSKNPCSWSFDGGILEKKHCTDNGVGGVFIFENKQILRSLPDECRFTKWLKDSGLKLSAFDLLDTHEIGTLNAFHIVDSGANRCRPYNSLDFCGETVKKSALTEEGWKLIEREVIWYRKMQEYGFPFMPKIYSYSPLTMAYINGGNIFNSVPDEQYKRKTITQLVEALNIMHNYDRRPADRESLHEEYCKKTLKRLDSVKDAIPFSSDEYIYINGNKCRNILFFRDEFQKLTETNLYCEEFCPIHGDGTLTNTMIDNNGDIYFIDARGYFGSNEVFGDIYYDWAKLYYSIFGNFDNFNIKKFNLEIDENEVSYRIQSSGWESLTEYFLSLITDCDLKKIKLIHAIIWLSLASHCWEDFDSLCAAFYIGTSHLEECW